jgi:DNA-directed RNA polymerase beta' subunit
LTALVAGGAGAIAAKTGLLAKAWKLILVGIAAVGAWLKKLFGGDKSSRQKKDIVVTSTSSPAMTVDGAPGLIGKQGYAGAQGGDGTQPAKPRTIPLR